MYHEHAISFIYKYSKKLHLICIMINHNYLNSYKVTIHTVLFIFMNKMIKIFA